MAIPYEPIVLEDLNLGTGQVTVTMPNGGTMTGTQINLGKIPKGDFILNLGFASVTDEAYGAKGDGTTDDTAAIQAALDSGAGWIVFPKGTYVVSSTLTVPGNTRVIFSSPGVLGSEGGSGGAVLKYTGSGPCLLYVECKHVVMDCPTIDLSGAQTGAVGIQWDGVWFGRMIKPSIAGKGGAGSDQIGIRIRTSHTGGHNYGSFICTIEDMDLEQGGFQYGLSIEQTPGDTQTNTHIYARGGWINGDANTAAYVRIDFLAGGEFSQITCEGGGGGDAYLLTNSQDIWLAPGETSVAGYVVNPSGSGNNQKKIYFKWWDSEGSGGGSGQYPSGVILPDWLGRVSAELATSGGTVADGAGATIVSSATVPNVGLNTPVTVVPVGTSFTGALYMAQVVGANTVSVWLQNNSGATVTVPANVNIICG